MTKPKTTKPASPWQPIETAPMDGSCVLVVGGLLSMPTSARYLDGWRQFIASYSVEHPTHWMPIPPLPEAAP